MEEPNKSSIPDIFQQRLQNASVPPPPFVWPAVEAALHARRRRRVLWLFVAGMAAVSALGLLLVRSNKGVWGIQNEHTEATENYQVLDNQALEPNTSAPTALQESSVNSEITESTRVFTPSRLPATQSTAPSNKKGVSNQAFTPEKESKTNAQSTTLGTQPIAAVPTSGAASTPDAAPKTLSIKSLHISSNKPIASENKSAQVLPKRLTAANLSIGKKQTPRFCYDFTRHPSAWLFDVYVGPSLAQSSLTSAIEDEPYLKQRLATESRSVAMQAGIRASWMFNRNFLIRSGLHYEQITETFEYIDPTSVVTSINNVYVNGQFVGTDTVVTYGKNYQKTYNRYGMLDIPLTLGVEMRSGRTGFNINAGISANVLFLKSGSIIDPLSDEPMRFGGEIPFTQEVFRPVVGLSTLASVQWYWHIDARHRLFVEPSFRQIMRPITSDRHPVSQRYSILGVRFGATKIF